MQRTYPFPRPTARNFRRGTLVLGLLSATLLSCVGGTGDSPAQLDPPAVQRSSLVTTGSFGGYNYRLFVPSSYSAGRAMPLVVMLHGCTQTPDSFATSTGMDALGESAGFLVAYPEQPTSANAIRCFRWFPRSWALAPADPSMIAQTATSQRVRRSDGGCVM